MAAGTTEKNAVNLYIRTRYTDEIDRGAGFTLVGTGSNLITDPFRILIAALFAGQGGFAGVQYFAVGSGIAGEDPLTPSAPLPTNTRLANEIARVPVTVSFLDDLGQAVVGGAGISRNVQIQAVFGPGIGTGNNIEFGLFGGNANAASGTGLLIDRVVHPLKHKTANDTRRLTLVFSF